MKSKIKIGLALLLGLFLFPIGHINDVQAVESKEILINQINTVENETLIFNATTGGRLEVVVPLAYASQNGNWSLWVAIVPEGGWISSDQKVYFDPYDVEKDTVVFRAYVPAGKYELDFDGEKAVCQINFIVDSIYDEIENNDSFETANQLYLNTEKRGEIYQKRNGRYDIDYFKVSVSEIGFLQFIGSAERGWSYGFNIYKEDQNGNIDLLYEDGLKTESKTPRFLATPGNYYVELKDGDASYVLTANFTSVTNSFHEVENNDVYISATEIQNNVEYSGNLEDKKDIDWYHMTLQTPQLAQVILKTPRQEDDEIYDITLYKNINDQLKKIVNFTSIKNNVMHNTEQKYLESGEYYIKVKKGGYFDNIEDIELSEQDYRIQLSTQSVSNLKKPTLSIKRSQFDEITLSFSDINSMAEKIFIYQKIGNGSWKYLKSVPSKTKNSKIKIKTFGKKYSYQIKYALGSYESEASKTKSITIPSKLPKPEFSVSKTKYYGTLAIYIKPTEYTYAKGVEVLTSDNGKYWDSPYYLNFSESKGLYCYNLEKGRSYYIKMRSYRKVNGKTIYYSPWTAVKKVVR